MNSSKYDNMQDLVKRLMSYDESVNVIVNSEDELLDFIDELRYKHCILFHLGDINYNFDKRTKTAKIYPEYLCTQNEYKKHVDVLIKVVENIKKKIFSTNNPEEIEFSIHNYICKNVTYKDIGWKSHSILGPLLHNYGVCDGISKTVKVLLQEFKIPSKVIYGSAKSVIQNVYEPHAWNLVQLNGAWYHLDTTFDMTLSRKYIRYDYFNLSTKQISTDHQIDDSFLKAAAECLAEDGLLAKRRLVFSTVDSALTHFETKLAAKEANIQFALSDDYQEDLCNKIVRLCQKAISRTNRIVSYEYSVNEARNIYVWYFDYV